MPILTLPHGLSVTLETLEDPIEVRLPKTVVIGKSP
jgi:hypothetical protein